MNIKFRSVITHQESEPRHIEFVAPVTLTEENGYQVLEFMEPASKTMNRIEIKEGFVNIFAGPGTIFLELDQHVKNEYQTPHGAIYFTSYMHSLVIGEHEAQITYNLHGGNGLIGDFVISISWN